MKTNIINSKGKKLSMLALVLLLSSTMFLVASGPLAAQAKVPQIH